MPYDFEEIKKSILFKWDGDDFYLLKYMPKRSGRANETTRFVLSFKENDKQAVNLAKKLFISVMEKEEHKLRDVRQCRYIVSIPSSTAGRVNVPAESVCSALGERFGWITHLPNALRRIKNVQKAAWAPPGERPTYETHVQTIRYKGRRLRLSNKTIIMIDDVITHKATSGACRHILKQATGCKRVTGIYLGRTKWN